MSAASGSQRRHQQKGNQSKQPETVIQASAAAAVTELGPQPAEEGPAAPTAGALRETCEYYGHQPNHFNHFRGHSLSACSFMVFLVFSCFQPVWLGADRGMSTSSGGDAGLSRAGSGRAVLIPKAPSPHPQNSGTKRGSEEMRRCLLELR